MARESSLLILYCLTHDRGFRQPSIIDARIASFRTRLVGCNCKQNIRRGESQSVTHLTGQFPVWAYVLRAVFTNSPNSIPPERVFSILNNTFDDDQKTELAD